MKMNKFSRLVCTLLVMALLTVPICALAGVGGVGVTNVVGELPIKYEQAVEQMYAMEALCPGAINVFTLAQKYGPECVSELERDLYVAKMGNGSRIIWIQAQIHGNEKLTTHALLDFMWDYANDASIRERYAGLTIYAIPVYNPDGNLKGQRGTDVYNDAGVITNTNLDLNRDWKTDLRGEGIGFVASESRAFYKFFCDIKPDWVFDLHHQGAKRGYGSSVNNITGSLGVSLAIDGPTLPNVLDGKYNTLTKQMQKYIYDQIIDDVQTFSNIPDIGTAFGIDLYGTGTDINILGGVASAVMVGIDYEGQNPYHYSCPASFFETESSTNGTVPISERWQKLIEQIYLATYAFMDGQASGDYLNIDPESYWDIPHYPFAEPRRYQTDQNTSLPEIDFSYLKPTVLSATPSAFVTQLNGPQNDLTITIEEKLSDKSTNILKETFRINNNATGVYKVGNYNVYVDTKGNTQIRECYIIYDEIKYTVKFVDWDGTVLKEADVVSGAAAAAPEDPVREGYTFAGWDVDFSNITSDLTVTAQYEENKIKYTVKFVDWDGTVLKEEEVVSGAAATAPEDPVRGGYVFAGWDVDFFNITENLIVTANYSLEITSIKIVTPQLTALGRGKALQLDVTVNEGASANYLVWSISNPALATVDANGLVTANHTLTGSVTVTAKSLDGLLSASVVLRIN